MSGFERTGGIKSFIGYGTRDLDEKIEKWMAERPVKIQGMNVVQMKEQGWYAILWFTRDPDEKRPGVLPEETA